MKRLLQIFLIFAVTLNFALAGPAIAGVCKGFSQPHKCSCCASEPTDSAGQQVSAHRTPCCDMRAGAADTKPAITSRGGEDKKLPAGFKAPTSLKPPTAGPLFVYARKAALASNSPPVYTLTSSYLC